MKHLFRFSVSIGLMVGLLSCAPQPYIEEPIEYIQPQSLPKTTKVEPEASKNFFEAEKAFRAKKYGRAAALFLRTKRKFPQGKAAMLSTYRLGTIYYYQNQYQTAAKYFEQFLEKYPHSDLAFDVRYNLAAANFQLGNYDDTYEILSQLRYSEIQLQGVRRAEMVYELMARAAYLDENHAGVIAANAAHTQLPIGDRKKQILHSKIDKNLEEIDNTPQLNKLLEVVTEPTTRSKISKRLAYLPLEEAAQTTFSYFGEGQPDLASAPVRTQPLKAGTKGNRHHIGVVLPLTGRWASFGHRALDAILLASKIYEQSGRTKFQLFIRDTGSNPINAQNVVDELFYQKNVMAILGPINWKEAFAVARRSQKLGVVNLSLTFKEGLSAKGSYLFQNALTPRVQLESLVDYCIHEKGLRRFAVLAPNDSFAQDMVNQFWTLVEAQGGRIVAYETYSPKQTDFQKPIKRLAGLTNLHLRRFEVAKVKEFIEEQEAEGVRNPKASIPPIVQFDALFVPDSPKTMGQIAPSLAYLDVGGFTLLGTTEWNSRELYKRAGKHIVGAMFPGGISLTTRNPKQKAFIKKYSEAYDAIPELLAAQAYEAMEILASAIQRTRSNNRNELVYQLFAMRNLETPLGKVSFDQTRLAQRHLPIYSVGPGGKLAEN